VQDVCRAVSQPERTSLWESANGALPEGKRIGWTCAVSYCSNPEHMMLAENKNSGKKTWGDLSARVAALEIDSSFELPDYPNSPRDVLKFRVGIGMTKAASHIRFLVRSLPDGGIRVIRVGTWASWAANRAPELTEKQYPVLATANMGRKGGYAKKRSMATTFFGFMSASVMHSRDVPQERCSFKGCVFPPKENGTCFQHGERWFRYPSFLWRGHLDDKDVWELKNGNGHTPHFSVAYQGSADALEKSTRFTYVKPQSRDLFRARSAKAKKNYNRMRKEERLYGWD
jgi:hypothetical protein